MKGTGRFLTRVMAVVGATAVVAACGGGGGTGGTSSSPPVNNGPASLTIECGCTATGTSPQSATWFQQYVIPAFEKQEKQKGRTVTVTLAQDTAGANVAQQEALDLRSHTGADIMAMDGFSIPQFASSGLLKPLNKLDPAADSWEGWQKIAPNVQQLMTYKNQRYGMPNGPDARVLWFRKDVLQKAGISTSWQPTSWNDVLQAAEKIKQKEPDVIPLQIDAGTAMQEASAMQGLYPLMLGAGNFMYDYKTNKYVAKSPGMLQALQLYRTIYVDKKLGDVDLQLAQNGRNQSFADFQSGKIGIYLESDYLWRTVLAGGQYKLANRDQLVGYAKIPAEAPGKGYRGQSFVNMSGGTGWVINPNSKDPKLAWDFMATMYSQQLDQQWEQIQPVIPLRSDVKVPDDATMTSLAKLLPITVVRPNVTTYPQVAQLIEQETNNVVSGQMTPQQAEDTYAAQLTKLVGAGAVESLNRSQAG